MRTVKLAAVALGCYIAAPADAFLGPAFTQRQQHRQQQPQQRQAPRHVLSMANTSDLKNGLTIDLDGQPCKVVEFLHVKPGKGSAFVRSKLKYLRTGNTVDKTFRAGETINIAQIDRFSLQFTYESDGEYYFMDMESFEEMSVPAAIVGDNADWISEGSEVDVAKYEGDVIEVSVPKMLELEVTMTSPPVDGGKDKDATLQSGVSIKIPNFIKQGETIRVDTEARKYMGRAERTER